MRTKRYGNSVTNIITTPSSLQSDNVSFLTQITGERINIVSRHTNGIITLGLPAEC